MVSSEERKRRRAENAKNQKERDNRKNDGITQTVSKGHTATKKYIREPVKPNEVIKLGSGNNLESGESKLQKIFRKVRDFGKIGEVDRKTGEQSYNGNKIIAGQPPSIIPAGAALETLGIAGKAVNAEKTVAAEKAVITSTKTIAQNARIKSTGEILKRGTTLTTQRAIVGKPAVSGVNKLFHSFKPIASRFATNSKSSALTTSLFKQSGVKTAAGAALLLSAFGTYPWAAHVKKEAYEALTFPMTQALNDDDLEGYEQLRDTYDDAINPSTIRNILSKIPYTNVVIEATQSIKNSIAGVQELDRLAAKKKLETGTLNNEAGTEEETELTTRQTELEQRQQDAEYYRLIREGKYEEADLFNKQLQGGNQ